MLMSYSVGFSIHNSVLKESLKQKNLVGEWIILTRDQDRASLPPKVCILHLGLVHHRLVLFHVHLHHHDVHLGDWEADGQRHPSSCLEVRQIVADQKFHCLLRGFWGNNSKVRLVLI